MPIGYQVETGLGLILVVGAGVLCDANLLRLSARMLADPDVRPCTLELDDWRALTRNDLSSDCLRSIADEWKKRDTHFAGAKLASVAPRDVDFGLTRMYQTFRDETPMEMQTFRDVGPAESWLDIPAGTAERLGKLMRNVSD